MAITATAHSPALLAPALPIGQARWAYPGYIFFFLLLFVPGAYQPIKAVVLAAVFACGAIQLMRAGGSLGLDKKIVWWSWLFVLIGLVFVLRGVMLGAPGALPVSTIFVVWPAIYLLLTALTSRLWVVAGLLRCAVIALIAINLYAWSFILTEVGVLPSFLYIPLDQRPAFEFYIGFVEFNLESITSYFFLIPFVLSALLVWPRRTSKQGLSKRESVSNASTSTAHAPYIETGIISRRWLWAAFVPSLLLTILSGRRALWLVVCLSPFVAIAFQSLLPGRRIGSTLKVGLGALVLIAGIVIGGVAYLQNTYGLNAVAMAEMFMTGFDFHTDEGAGIRAIQFDVLLRGLFYKPLLGHGLGAVADIVRADDAPWGGYELFFAHLLFQTGLLGFAMYSLGVVWIYISSIRIIRAGTLLSLYMIPILTGTTCFLIAATTNPYLGTSGYMWVIFLPVALINIYLRKADQPTGAERMQSPDAIRGETACSLTA